MATSPWDTLWTNARIATLRGGRYSIAAPGAIAASGGTNAWVGVSASLPAAPLTLARVVHDVSGRWITPGLIDCHTHLVIRRQPRARVRPAAAGRELRGALAAEGSEAAS